MGEVLQGLGVSSGVAVGRILLLEPDSFPAVPVPIPPGRVAEEIERLRGARGRARNQLQDLRDRVREVLGEHYAAMLEAQLLILDDPGLVSETERRVRDARVSAAWSLKEVVEDYTRKFESVDHGYLRERGGDLADVHRRLQRLLRGDGLAHEPIPGGPMVLVAHSVGPSDAVALAREGVVGLATDVGGPTSHTAILAQALCLPAVVGLRDISLRARPGESIALDGGTGRVELGPAPADLERARERREAWLARESAMAIAPGVPAVTRDGLEVVLRANVEFPEQVAAALRYGAQGVGLYRSEFLFLTRYPELPTEEDHYRVYREMAEKVAPHPAVIRTLDLGGEKHFQQVLDRGVPNPVLGLRAVRFSLSRPDIFVPQLRALLRAAAHGDLRILIPLVSTREEILSVRALLAEQVSHLRAVGVDHRADVPVGVMVEVPAAAATADLLARDADFLSIGTNDLIQYALAVDRSNEAVASLYQPLHPAVLRMVSFVVRSASASGVPVSICGEMAADASLAGLLVGLGLRELSLEPRAIAAVREAIQSLDSREAARVAAEAVDLPTAADVARRLAVAARQAGGTETP